MDGQKSLHSTAKNHGVENYAFFQNQGYIGMYNMGLGRLLEIKGVKKGELIDRMGKEEMAAHLFRITQTDAKIKKDDIRGQKPLERTAREVGQTVRKTMVELSGTAPENLPISANVRDVRKKIKGASKSFKALDGPKKKAADKRPKKGEQD